MADRLNDLEESEKAARRALVELEREVLRLRAKEKNGKPNSTVRILSKEIYEEGKDDEKAKPPEGWFARLAALVTPETDEKEAKETLAQNAPGPAEKILVQADQALDEKHRQAMEAAEKAVADQNPKRRDGQ